MRSYQTARSLFSFLAFIAWSTVTIGVLVALISAEGVSRYAGDGAGLLAMVPGIGIGITGLILVAFVQMGRATVDTAEYTQQMLKISRDQLEVSKQSLKLQNTSSQSFADATQHAEPSKPNNSFASQPSKPKVAGKLPEPAMDTEHQGKLIEALNGKFVYNGIPFDTRVSAQKYIDKFGRAPAKKLTGVSRNS